MTSFIKLVNLSVFLSSVSPFTKLIESNGDVIGIFNWYPVGLKLPRACYSRGVWGVGCGVDSSNIGWSP